LGNEEEQERRKRWWYKMRREAGKKIYDKMNPQFLDIFRLSADEEEITEERNDVYIYKTLRYPPKSIPPSVN
jgi:hypothetical protein